MIKIYLAAFFIGVLLTGCANISENQGVNISGQVSYEYQKSL
jgi:hypothetical protein